MSESNSGRGGLISRLWRALWRPSARWSVAALIVVGGVGGIASWIGYDLATEHTNTLEFCISCHEMKDTVYEEYTKSVHYLNASGVRAVCSDCHTPRDWPAKLLREIQAVGELFAHLTGTIDTPEKFEAARSRMAEHVWAGMKARDSQECRNCHSYQAMDFHKQTARASEKMQEAQATGATCIDCHKGIAHKLPPSDD